jgi:hypothetical protein
MPEVVVQPAHDPVVCRRQLIAPIGEPPQHHRDVLGHDLPQLTSVRRRDRGRAGIVAVGLARRAAREQPHPGREGGGHVGEWLTSGDQLRRVTWRRPRRAHLVTQSAGGDRGSQSVPAEANDAPEGHPSRRPPPSLHQGLPSGGEEQPLGPNGRCDRATTAVSAPSAWDLFPHETRSRLPCHTRRTRRERAA